MKASRKSRFWIGLAIYVGIMLLLIAGGLVFFWQYIAEYEISRTDTVVNEYLASSAMDGMAKQRISFAQAHATEYESAHDIEVALLDTLPDAELTARKVPGDSDEGEQVYTIRAGKTEIGRVTLTPEDGRFGFKRWVVASSEFNFDGFDHSITVTAPEGTVVTVNGVALTDAQRVDTFLYPELESYERELPTLPQAVRYEVSGLYGDVQPSFPADFTVERDGYSFTAVQSCPADLEAELTQYTADFVSAYIAFTSHATGSSGSVQKYMIPGSSLYQRMSGALDGLSWVKLVTGTLDELTIDNFAYYGDIVTCDASYTIITPVETLQTAMHIILANTDDGWRVAAQALI
jgi:hypothetical protein